ncbi:hypothetical protein F4801DRAFT_597169 [Xylaria longipes]|nr:hypothetical protein F4801DRAFT_597169 [Xylaria longipes]RYC57205.1 hypothetical protein CHU98_g8999 [Xylaria longipes]
MTGFLIPPWFKEVGPSSLEMNIASIFFGISLAVAFFSAGMGGRQAWKAWKRTGGTNSYIILLWTEWTANIIMGTLTWFFLLGLIPPSFGFFFVIVTIWCLQVQCIIQIIINRISLLMRNKKRVLWMKWGIAGILLCVNISVYTIWIPARLQISESYIRVNDVWDRLEKGIFLVIDASLNVYFVYLVRSKLIANGLHKYTRLYRFNIIMIVCSTALDAILIGVMSLENGFIYLQFHPFVYLVKLHIELNLTQLLAKIVRLDEGDSGLTGSKSKEVTGRKSNPIGTNAGSRGIKMATLITTTREFTELRDSDPPNTGIQKTVETKIEYNKDDDDRDSHSSSTRELNEFYNV